MTDPAHRSGTCALKCLYPVSKLQRNVLWSLTKGPQPEIWTSCLANAGGLIGGDSLDRKTTCKQELLAEIGPFGVFQLSINTCKQGRSMRPDNRMIKTIKQCYWFRVPWISAIASSAEVFQTTRQQVRDFRQDCWINWHLPTRLPGRIAKGAGTYRAALPM
jgi:hypothetical protein